MRCFLLITLLAISTTAACSQPKELYQKAVITGSGESLCVKANDVPELKKTSPAVTNVSIYERIDGAQRIIWQQSYPPADGEVPTVSSTECMKDLGGRGNPLPSLLPGKQYSIDIAAGIADRDGDMVRRWYSAYFCVVRSGDSSDIRQVVFDRRREVWRWDTCGL